MAGFPNLGGTCFANSVLKLLIHSTGPQRLTEHLVAGLARPDLDATRRETTMKFIQLIESSYSETGPTPADLTDFFASLQKLPAFATLDATGQLDFPLGNTGQDANEFMIRLSESFELSKLNGNAIELHDETNGFKTEGEYWTLLRPANAHDSLQDLFDQTGPAKWLVTPGENLRQLSVRIANNIPHPGNDNPPVLSTRNFNFNQSLRLKATDATTNRPLVLTLEPRGVMEFVAGHYLIYAKDGQWFQHDDAKVQALGQIPAIEDARMINFAVVKVEPAS